MKIRTLKQAAKYNAKLGDEITFEPAKEDMVDMSFLNKTRKYKQQI
jgi:hypothetical protein